MDFEQAIGDVNSKVGVDADEVGVERILGLARADAIVAASAGLCRSLWSNGWASPPPRNR